MNSNRTPAAGKSRRGLIRTPTSNDIRQEGGWTATRPGELMVAGAHRGSDVLSRAGLNAAPRSVLPADGGGREGLCSPAGRGDGGCSFGAEPESDGWIKIAELGGQASPRCLRIAASPALAGSRSASLPHQRTLSRQQESYPVNKKTVLDSDPERQQFRSRPDRDGRDRREAGRGIRDGKQRDTGKAWRRAISGRGDPQIGSAAGAGPPTWPPRRGWYG